MEVAMVVEEVVAGISDFCTIAEICADVQWK